MIQQRKMIFWSVTGYTNRNILLLCELFINGRHGREFLKSGDAADTQIHQGNTGGDTGHDQVIASEPRHRGDISGQERERVLARQC